MHGVPQYNNQPTSFQPPERVSTTDPATRLHPARLDAVRQPEPQDSPVDTPTDDTAPRAEEKTGMPDHLRGHLDRAVARLGVRLEAAAPENPPTPSTPRTPEVSHEEQESSPVSQYHNPQYDQVREEAHRFTSETLGLSVAPRENIALINPAQAVAAREQFGDSWGGGYNPTDNTALIVQNPNLVGPHTTSVYNRSATVHEIAHSGTATESQHSFFREALSGVAEYKFMDSLRETGGYQPAGDFTLQRAGTGLWVPSNMRYLDARDAVGAPTSGPTGAHSSQGLLAALGVGISMRASGLTSDALLEMSSRGGTAQYDAMRASLDALRPGLARAAEAMPETTDGVIQTTALIQAEARKQGLL